MRLWVAGSLEQWSMRRTNIFTLNIQESLLPESLMKVALILWVAVHSIAV